MPGIGGEFVQFPAPRQMGQAQMTKGMGGEITSPDVSQLRTILLQLQILSGIP
jgi:hypothetical protein